MNPWEQPGSTPEEKAMALTRVWWPDANAPQPYILAAIRVACDGARRAEREAIVRELRVLASDYERFARGVLGSHAPVTDVLHSAADTIKGGPDA